MTIALISIYNVKEPTSSMYYHKLYNLLSERKPYQNISHKKMHTWKEHVAFLDSKPYKAWYIIYKDQDFAGSIYLSKNNEIGLFLRESFKNQGIGKKALKTLLKTHKNEKTFYANIAPFNSASLAFFTNMGFQMHKTLYSEGIELADKPENCIIQYTLIFSLHDSQKRKNHSEAEAPSEFPQHD
jgi:RimJ/RimL family protein N-acetyltransferase